MDISQFAAWAKRMGQRVERNADRLARRCALAVDGAVVIATPVDTGRARSNWIVNLDSANTTTREPYSPGQDGATGGANARSAIEQGSAEIARYRGGHVNAAIHITNNLAYIGRLNNGHSAQAPAGFVEKAVMVGVDAIRGQAIVTRS